MYKLIRTTFVTDEVTFKNNKIKLGNYKLLPNLKREVGKVKDSTYFTRLTLNITNTPENPFPVDARIIFVGIFTFENIDNEANVFDFLKIQAVEIMYPYLRSLLSSLTINAFMPPIILPVVDIPKIFPDSNSIIVN